MFGFMDMMDSLHNQDVHSFASDNYSGVLPEVMHALAAANGGHVAAYGGDVYTRQLEVLARQYFGAQAQIFPVFNGTGANVLALQAVLPRWGAAVCAETAHIHTDESTAPQAVGGLKLWTFVAEQGKLTVDLLAEQIGDDVSVHRAPPLAVSITQSTELGTVYTPSEISDLAAFCRRRGMVLHMDGARLANAAAALDVSLACLTSDAGVDIVSFGGTKNGLLFGECIVLVNPQRVPQGLEYLRKVNLQLASKMRFLSAQFIALLQDGLWRRAAGQANRMAALLAEGLAEIEGVRIMYPVEANAVFARLPAGVAEKVRRHTAFYDWDEQGTVRFVCSFDTQVHHVAALLHAVRQAVV